MKGKKVITVLFMVPSPVGISPGQRFRFEHFLPEMEAKGMHYKISPFLSLRGRKNLYSKGNIIGKIVAILGGYKRRVADIFTLGRYDYIYIHRWAATAGPPVFEWLAKLLIALIVLQFFPALFFQNYV